MKVYIATRHMYDKEDGLIFRTGDVLDKDYGSNYCIETTLKQLAELAIAVDDIFYDVHNQWQVDMDLDEFLEDLLEIKNNIWSR